MGNPVGRFAHSMVTTTDGSVWMFGGMNLQVRLASLHKLDVETQEWTEITTSGEGPSARAGHGMVSVGSDIYLFGGTISQGERGEGPIVSIVETPEADHVRKTALVVCRGNSFKNTGVD